MRPRPPSGPARCPFQSPSHPSARESEASCAPRGFFPVGNAARPRCRRILISPTPPRVMTTSWHRSWNQDRQISASALCKLRRINLKQRLARDGTQLARGVPSSFHPALDLVVTSASRFIVINRATVRCSGARGRARSRRLEVHQLDRRRINGDGGGIRGDCRLGINRAPCPCPCCPCPGLALVSPAIIVDL